MDDPYMLRLAALIALVVLALLARLVLLSLVESPGWTPTEEGARTIERLSAPV